MKIKIYGQPATCMPCKITEGILKNWETDKKFDNIEFEYIVETDKIIEKGFRSVPIMELETPSKTYIQQDKSILMNEENLENWINDQLANHQTEN